MDNLTEPQAFEILTSMLGYKGTLKMITSELNPDRDPNIDSTVPSYFIQHDIVKLQVIPAQADGDRMEVKARTEEGDWARGSPKALLSILTKWETLEPDKGV